MYTTTEQIFLPGHLSRLPLGLEQKVAFVPGPTASRASGGQGPFVPVGATNRDKRPPFCPGWCLQPGQNSLAPLSPSLSLYPSHSAHLFLLFLARQRGVLAHLLTTFVKIFDSPSIHWR